MASEEFGSGELYGWQQREIAPPCRGDLVHGRHAGCGGQTCAALPFTKHLVLQNSKYRRRNTVRTEKRPSIQRLLTLRSSLPSGSGEIPTASSSAGSPVPAPTSLQKCPNLFTALLDADT